MIEAKEALYTRLDIPPSVIATELANLTTDESVAPKITTPEMRSNSSHLKEGKGRGGATE